MAINCYVKTGITGQTIVATTTDFTTNIESSAFSCTEIDTSGRYKGVIASIADGSYYVDFFIGSSVIDSGFFSCVGNVEITPATINAKTSLLPSDPASNAQVNTRMETFTYTAPPTATTISTQVWAETARSLTDKTGYSLTTGERSAIATEVEAHLLNEGDSQMLINAIVGAIGNTNIDQTVLIAAIRADLERSGGKIDSLPTAIWANTARTITDKTGFSLTSGERTAISTEVQAGILNEADGQLVLNAIVGAIGNSNIDEVALVAAIRADIERNGGLLDTLPLLTEIEASTVLAKAAVLTSISSSISSLPSVTDIVNAIFTKVIETGETFIQNIRIVSSIIKGTTTGIGTNTENFNSKDKTKIRYSVEFDSNGNRLNTTEDGD